MIWENLSLEMAVIFFSVQVEWNFEYARFLFCFNFHEDTIENLIDLVWY